MEAAQPRRSATLAGQKSTKGTADPLVSPTEPSPRPACPRCGSAHTQPFTHSGPGSRVNMKCIDCSLLFKFVLKRED